MADKDPEVGLRPGADDPVLTKVVSAKVVTGLVCPHTFPAITVDGEAFHESGAKSPSGANVWHPCELLLFPKRKAR